MATKTYCDICGTEITHLPVAALAEVLPESAAVQGRRAEHVCEGCLRRAFEAPARPDPKYGVEHLMHQPLADVLEGATDLVPGLAKETRTALAERLATCVAERAWRISKEVR